MYTFEARAKRAKTLNISSKKKERRIKGKTGEGIVQSLVRLECCVSTHHRFLNVQSEIIRVSPLSHLECSAGTHLHISYFSKPESDGYAAVTMTSSERFASLEVIVAR